MMKKIFAAALLSMPTLALAQTTDRAAGSQVSYLTEVTGGLGALALAVAFFAGIVILIIAGTFAFRDYVMETREKKFSIAQLLFGIVIGALLVYPGAAFLMGQDLATGDNAGQEVSADDFKRDGQ